MHDLQRAQKMTSFMLFFYEEIICVHVIGDGKQEEKE